ncbi:MAG: DNA primase [Bacteroidales bacterium]|nr:DNA primase [Bacteroidales bacterium]MBQ3917717.1 DNA primase [Bacteroidales bacterium]MBQ5528798.1 DNA primase [Bacteroidales bacterium]MEE3406753.1 DNA primase [Candidatus Cryptobacteroides sp.]SKC50097.1 DNA primase [Bacteroidales bacterium WCE2008]
MIPQETVNQILDAAQIVDVVGDFVTLKRRGANYVACCPFHNEKTPSFYVSPSKGIYKCFGCGKSGTAVGFIMEHENLSYVEALRYLARKYGIEVKEKEESAEDIAARQRSESLLLVSEAAGKFFADSLSTEEGRTIGLAYFKSRGLEEETIKKYGLGWAPRSRHALLDYAKSAGYKEEYLVDTGLCVKHDDGKLSDRFYDRVMFPVHSVSGRVIAFGGRTLRTDKTIAKYVNSPETEIYDKSRSLYGIYFAKNEISRSQKCYLVEGYLDVLSMHQLGITNVVASSGTSLTVPQIRLIKKFTENVTIMYDGDSAGIHAAIRGIGLVLKEGLNVKIVLLPDGDDPDSYSRKHSLQEVQDFIENHEQDFIAFKTDLLLGEAGDDPLRKAELINDIADTIALIPDPVKRTVYAQTSAEKFNIDSQIIFERVKNTREKMIEDDRRAAERDRMRRNGEEVQEQETPAAAYSPAAEPEKPTVAGGMVLENKVLAPAEEELLWFILKYGLDPLEFETDSEFYDPEGTCNVADFIRSLLETDHFVFKNSAYRRTYDAYFALYDAHEEMGQDEIIKAMMDGEDRMVAELTGQMTEERYQLTVRNFASAMTATSTKLVMYVPRSIQVYQAKRIQVRLREIEKELKDASPEEQRNLLKEMQEYITVRNKIEKHLGRVR